MADSILQIENDSTVSQIGRIYTEAKFKPGDFIYFHGPNKSPNYRIAYEGFCDFFVVAAGENYVDVVKHGFFEISQYSTLRYLDRILGSVYLDSKGRITSDETLTKIGYVDKNTIYLDISNSSTSPGPLGATSTQIEYVSSGPIIDIPVYFSAEQVSQSLTADLVNGHIVNSNSKLKKAFLVLNDAGIKGDILSLPVKFIVSIQTQLGELFSLHFNINSTQVGKFYPAECRIYSEILDLNVPVNKGDTVFLKFENDTVVYGDTSTITYYGTAKILLELEEV